MPSALRVLTRFTARKELPDERSISRVTAMCLPLTSTSIALKRLPGMSKKKTVGQVRRRLIELCRPRISRAKDEVAINQKLSKVA
jgi:hypothetical protein